MAFQGKEGQLPEIKEEEYEDEAGGEEEVSFVYAYPHDTDSPEAVWLGFPGIHYWTEKEPPSPRVSLLQRRFALYKSRLGKMGFRGLLPSEVDALLWGLAAMDLYAIEHEYAFGLKQNPNAVLSSLGNTALSDIGKRYAETYGDGLLANLPEDSTTLIGLSFLQFCTNLPEEVKSTSVLQAVVALYRRVMAAESSFCLLVDEASRTGSMFSSDPLFPLIQADARGDDRVPVAVGDAAAETGAGAGSGIGAVLVESIITPYQQAAFKRLETIRVAVCAAVRTAVSAGIDAESYQGRLVACLHQLIPVTRAHARDQSVDFTWAEGAIAPLRSASETIAFTPMHIVPPWSAIEQVLYARKLDVRAIAMLIEQPDLQVFVGSDFANHLLKTSLTQGGFWHDFVLPTTPGIQALKPVVGAESPVRGGITPPIPSYCQKLCFED